MISVRLRAPVIRGTARAARWLLAHMPDAAVSSTGACLGWIGGVVLRIRRRATDRNLARAFPERGARWRARIARESYRHLGREALMLFRLAGDSPAGVRDRSVVHGLDRLRTALARGDGALLLTGHLGSWEMAAATLAAHGVSLDVIVKGMASRVMEDELFHARERLGVGRIHLRDAPEAALRALAVGRAVGIAGDQNAHRGGVFVPFFGLPASTHRGAAVLALRSGAPVFLIFAVRTPRGGYEVRLEDLPVPRSGEARRDVSTFTAAYMSAVEREVRRYPGQYLWQHLRWKTRPTDGKPGRAYLS